MVIPNGWLLDIWANVLDGFITGATPYRGKPSYYNGSIPWVSSGELNYNNITDTLEHISKVAVTDNHLMVHPPGTFLMAISGLEAAGTRGSCALLGIAATTNQSCLAIYSTPKMSVQYLFYYYCLNGDKLAFEYCQGTKQQDYTASIVRKLPIIYPQSVSEQQAIAAALSDADGYIAALERLIAKKRYIKQGTMQKLLRPKDGWENKTLGDVLTVSHGQSHKNIKEPSGKYPILATSGEIGRTNVAIYDKPSVLIGRKGTIDKPQYMDVPFWTIDTLFYTIVKEGYSP